MDALFFGVIASSALVIGALVGARIQLPKRLLAAMLAFAAGALITALAFELFEESVDRGGIGRAAVGLALGAVVFTVLSARLDAAARAGPVRGRDPEPARLSPRDQLPTSCSCRPLSRGSSCSTCSQ